MKVLGVGLSKTGTSSLQHALRLLGYRYLHFDTKRLNDVVDGTSRAPNFRRYDDVDAALDIPSTYFFEELIAAYPSRKCILTLRDEDDWWRSIERHSNIKSPLTKPEQDPFRCRLDP